MERVVGEGSIQVPIAQLYPLADAAGRTRGWSGATCLEGWR